MNKIYDEDGWVAVLINGEHGIGWSTAAQYEDRESLMFDGAIVNMVRAAADGWQDEVRLYCKEKYPDFYCVPNNLVVMWVKPGDAFFIEEYDGDESIRYQDQIHFFVA